MEIFKWAKDLEKTYDDLIDKAKEDSLEEIQLLKLMEEKVAMNSLREKQELISVTLKGLNDALNDSSYTFESMFQREISNIEEKYHEIKRELIHEIFKKMGLDF